MKKIIIIFLLLMLVCCCYYGYMWMMEANSLTNIYNAEGRIYTANPETILDELSNQDFSSLVLVDEADHSESWEPVDWSTDDFIFAANMLHQLVWEESTDTWKMSGISFEYDCQSIENGPWDAMVQYHKFVRTRSRLYFSGLSSVITIDSKYGYFITDTKEFYPTSKIFGIGGFVYSDLEVTPEEALQIAEEQGGEDFRESVNNMCTIDVDYLPSTYSKNNWRIIYKNGDERLNFLINPKNGEVIAE